LTQVDKKRSVIDIRGLGKKYILKYIMYSKNNIKYFHIQSLTELGKRVHIFHYKHILIFENYIYHWKLFKIVKGNQSPKIPKYFANSFLAKKSNQKDCVFKFWFWSKRLKEVGLRSVIFWTILNIEKKSYLLRKKQVYFFPNKVFYHFKICCNDQLAKKGGA